MECWLQIDSLLPGNMMMMMQICKSVSHGDCEGVRLNIRRFGLVLRALQKKTRDYARM